MSSVRDYLLYLLEAEDSEEDENNEALDSDDKENDEETPPEENEGDSEGEDDESKAADALDNMDDGNDEDDNEDPDETILSKMKRHDAYKRFMEIKESFSKLEKMIYQFRYNDSVIINKTEALRWSFDNYTEFYDKMTNGERTSNLNSIHKEFFSLLRLIKRRKNKERQGS